MKATATLLTVLLCLSLVAGCAMVDPNYQPQTRRPYGVMEWPALLRKLDRLDPSYRY